MYSITTCIPKYWKYIIFDTTDLEFSGYNVDRYTYECRDTYKELLKKIVYIPEQYVTMWEKLLEIEINEWDWYRSYTDCLHWTVSTKLRSFYYQLRVGDIMSNHKLVNMKLKDDAICQWCNHQDQDILHLFWDCTVIKELWNRISLWISACLDNHLEIKRELVFLYDIEAGNYTVIINLLILTVTRYIYVCM